MGTNTDPYQPTERKLGITRSILEVLQAADHPVCIVTKSALIQRDIDILAAMAKKRLATVSLSVTTLDRGLARTLEPRAATPERRLETIRVLAEAGIPTGVLAAPMIPALNDAELEAILAACKEAGALTAGYVLLRLPHELKGLFREWLQAHVPGRAKHVMSLVTEMHGGKEYDAQWGRRQTGTGRYAEVLRIRFELACKRLGLKRGGNARLDTTLFRRPAAAGDQLSLL